MDAVEGTHDTAQVAEMKPACGFFAEFGSKQSEERSLIKELADARSHQKCQGSIKELQHKVRSVLRRLCQCRLSPRVFQ